MSVPCTAISSEGVAQRICLCFSRMWNYAMYTYMTWRDRTGHDMTYAYQYHPPKLTHSSHYLGFYLALVVVYLDLWMIPTVCLYIKHLLVHTVHTSKAIYSIWARSAIAGRKIIVFTQPVTTGDLPSIREIPTFTAWIGLWPGEEENGDCAWGAMNS